MIFPRDGAWLNASHILMDGLYDSVPILLSFMVVYYGAGEKDAGLIISLGVCVSTIGGLTTKFFGACCGLWGSLTLTLGCAGAGFLGNAFAPTLALSGLCFVLAICGMGLYHSLTFAHFSVHSPKRLLGKAIGDFTAIGDVGRIPIASLAGFGAALTLVGEPGWRVVCLVYGVITLFFALCLWRRSASQKAATAITLVKATSLATPAAETRTSDTTAETASPRRKESLLPSFSLLRKRAVALTMVTNVLDGFSSSHIFTFLPFLLFAKGIDPKVIGGFALTFAAGSLIGKMICGRLAAYCGALKVFVGSELLMVFLLISMVLIQDMWWILATSILLGVVTRGTVPVLQTLLVEPLREPDPALSCSIPPSSSEGRFASQCQDIFSLSSLFRGGMNMLTPLLFGIISAASSIENVYMLMAVVALLAIIPVLILRKESR